MSNKQNIFLALTIFIAIGFSACEDAIDLDLGAPTEQIVIDQQIDSDTKTYSKSSSKPVYTNTHNYSKISDMLDELQNIFKFNLASY